MEFVVVDPPDWGSLKFETIESGLSSVVLGPEKDSAGEAQQQL
jgi:hypothetical protein